MQGPRTSTARAGGSAPGRVPDLPGALYAAAALGIADQLVAGPACRTLSVAQAVAIILDQVRAGAWRILVGKDAKMIYAAVRARPEAAYGYTELFSEMAQTPPAVTPEP
jgi:hypothetical protein